MSLKEEQTGKYFMGKNTLILPTNPIVAEAQKLRSEKEVQEAQAKLVELDKAKQAELEAKLETTELIPFGNKIILMPYPTNPYRRVLQGSIIVEYDGGFKNPDSGEWERQKTFVGCAQVIEVGPECKYLKIGDDVFYDTRTVYPVPFYSMGYVLTGESQILCVMNEKLKERFNML